MNFLFVSLAALLLFRVLGTHTPSGGLEKCALLVPYPYVFALCSSGHIGSLWLCKSLVLCREEQLFVNHLKMSEREDNVYKAKLAEQAERYDGEYYFLHFARNYIVK